MLYVYLHLPLSEKNAIVTNILFCSRERDLLDEGNKTTVKVTQNIIQAMTYKISHEWFGGEISTTWWSDFWANEAVPMYFKYIIPNQVSQLYFTKQNLI